MDSVVVAGPESLPFTTKTNFPVPVKKFYQGEPLALGIAQIFIGMIGIIFGMLIDIVNKRDIFYLIVWMPYWSGILYIISGSLAVAAARNPRMPLVQSMLAMNVLSTVAAGLGLASLFVTFALPYLYSLNLYCGTFENEIKEKCNQIENFGNGIPIILTVFTALEFCITISVASFGCKMLCRNTFPETHIKYSTNPEYWDNIFASEYVKYQIRQVLKQLSTEVVVIYQNVSPASVQKHPPLDCKQPAIHP